MDPNLGLTTKIAPATLGERETFLPRAPNLDNRASALLQKVLSLAFSPPPVCTSAFLCAVLCASASLVAYSVCEACMQLLV